MVEERIEKACKVIENGCLDKYTSGEYLRIFSFTNENLSYMGLFDYKGKNVLTTGSSLDQTINLISCGCKDITILDTNPFVIDYGNLKIAAHKLLDPKDFLCFLHGTELHSLFSKSKIVFDPDTYSRISKEIPEESRKFWDTLFNKYDPVTIKKQLFNLDDELSKKSIIKNNYYLDPENYKKVRGLYDKVNIKFCHDRIPSLKHLTGTYHYIYLSNIFAAITNIASRITPEEKFEARLEYKARIKQLMSYLKEDGILFYDYIWEAKDSDDELFYEQELKKFSEEIIVPSSKQFPGDYDLVYMAKKRALKK